MSNPTRSGGISLRALAGGDRTVAEGVRSRSIGDAGSGNSAPSNDEAARRPRDRSLPAIRRASDRVRTLRKGATTDVFDQNGCVHPRKNDAEKFLSHQFVITKKLNTTRRNSRV